MERQLTVNKNNPESFFSRIQDILDLYNLPPIYVLVDALSTKLAWKRGINMNIVEKWTYKLSEEVEGKSTMKLCNGDILKNPRCSSSLELIASSYTGGKESPD